MTQPSYDSAVVVPGAVAKVMALAGPLGLTAPDSLLPGMPLAGPLGEAIRARDPSLGEFTLRPRPLTGTPPSRQ